MKNYTVKLPLDPHISLKQLLVILEEAYGHSISTLNTKLFRIETMNYTSVHYYYQSTFVFHIELFTYIYNYKLHELYIEYQGNKYQNSKLINLLLENDLICDDHGLSMSYDAQMARNGESDLDTLRIHHYNLPVVYIPVHTINPDKLNSQLRGLAHIYYNVVPDSISKIQVYLPNGTKTDFDSNLKEIVHYIYEYLNHISYGDSFNQEKLLLDHLDSLDLEEISQTERLQQLTSIKEKEVNEQKLQLENEIALLKEEIDNLQYTIDYIQEDFDGFPVIYKGYEKDIYPYEQHDMILGILETSLSNKLNKDSIEGRMLKELIKQNPRLGKYHYYRDQLRDICKQYRDVNPQMMSELEALVFEFVKLDSSNHIRIYFKGERRYYAEFSSTASDQHSLDATRRDMINRYMF